MPSIQSTQRIIDLKLIKRFNTRRHQLGIKLLLAKIPFNMACKINGTKAKNSDFFRLLVFLKFLYFKPTYINL